ncbi:30S ribosomal protein S6 [Lewinella sp. LCG006]|uniref:30S ribosomal protein S6 n=1 Tax=Lewinella sp. LCG006 TaxID=3231911 RepID=UPI0034609D73
MRNYEVTFIVDPVLSGEEIKTTAQTYSDMLKTANANIVHIDEMGLRTLAYPINKRNSGVYYCIEFQMDTVDLIDDLELALRRDERIMRFLTYKLDKFGIKYNEDKRNGLIGKAKRPKSKEKKEGRERNDRNDRNNDRRGNAPQKPASKPAPAAAKQEEE